MIATPAPLTWANSAILTASDLNIHVRDAMRFLTTSGHTSVYLASNVSIPQNVRTAIVWDTTTDDQDNLITTPSGTFTITREGVIAIRFMGTYGLNTTGTYRRIILTLNGNDYAASAYCVGVNSDALSLATELPVAVGDTLQFLASHDATAAVTMLAAQTQVSLMWVGLTDATAAPAPSLPPTGQTPTKHTVNFDATFSRTYNGDGTTSADDTKYCYQGYYDGNRGNNRSLVGFNSTSIVSTLNNAQRITMKLRFHVARTYQPPDTFISSGVMKTASTVAIIGGHNYATKPATWADANVDQNLTRKVIVPGQTYEVSLPSSMVARLASGGYKGIAFGPGPSNLKSYYALINGATQASPPRLEVVYYS